MQFFLSKRFFVLRLLSSGSLTHSLGEWLQEVGSLIPLSRLFFSRAKVDLLLDLGVSAGRPMPLDVDVDVD